MNPGFSKTFWISLFLLGSVLPASPAHGQTFIPYPVEQTALAIQWEKPFTLDVFAAYSSILEADAIVPLGSGRSLQIGVPLAVAGVDMIDGTSTYLGNIRASLLYGELDR